MKKELKKFVVISLLSSVVIIKAFGQVPVSKEYSKEISLHKAKAYVINDVLGQSNEVVKFEVDPLAAATSGELTSLVYKCGSKNKQGLILGFYGNKWNEHGVLYQAYGFKNLPEKEANEFLEKLAGVLSDNEKYVKADADNNNLYFHYQDLTVLIYIKGFGNTTFRIFWGEFDAEWELIAFERTKKRFHKKLK